jgi:hypothetical protein
MGAPSVGLQDTSPKLLLRKQRAQARDDRFLGSIAAGCAKAPEVKVAAREKPRPGQGIAARSPTRFDATTSRLGPFAPGSAGRGRQELVSGLQRLGVERIIDESSRDPAGSLPRHRRPCDEAAPKWPGLSGQLDRQLPAWRSILVRTERLFLPQLIHDYSCHSTLRLPTERQISPPPHY